MSFFYLLKQNSFQWEKAKDIFYKLTEPQILWINEACALDIQKQEKEAEDRRRESERSNKFGTETNKKSFNLRG